jgi:hypothetical protein
MYKMMLWPIASLALGMGVTVVGPALCGGEPARPKKLTAEESLRAWSPRLKSATDYQQWGGSPGRSPDIAAYSFRVVGPTFEELWNHYAELCGVKDRYAEKMFLNTADDGPRGSYVVSDRWTADSEGGRGLSVFLLKTETYTVTVTLVPGPGGKSISGSLSAVVP